MRRGYQTQWAGQFGVAHELTRRGYLVTFTTCNARDDDLLCLSPSGVAFSVQVKSLSSKTFFLYQKSLLASPPTRYFVFVLVPLDCSKQPEYFVVNHGQFKLLADEQEQDAKRREERRGKRYATFAPGIYYSIIAKNKHDFRNAWDNLPK